MSDLGDSAYDERKRSHEDDELMYSSRGGTSGPTRNSKRPTIRVQDIAGKTFAFRCLLSIKESGVIIGKQGKSISDLRNNSNAKISISDLVQGSLERILTIVGTYKTTSKAFRLLAEHIPIEIERTNKPKNEIYTFRLLIPHARMGILIGKGGSAIKELQERTGAKLNASEEMLNQSTERIMSISGTPYQLESVIIEICKLLRELPERSSQVIHYRPSIQSNYNDYPFNFNSGQQYNNNNNNIPYNTRPNFMPSNLEFNVSNANGILPTHIQQIFIPNEMVGCIIGKGGNKINEMRMISGANIKVGDPIENSNERLITITGTPESNGLALNLLYTRLETEKLKIFPQTIPANDQARY